MVDYTRSNFIRLQARSSSVSAGTLRTRIDRDARRSVLSANSPRTPPNTFSNELSSAKASETTAARGNPFFGATSPAKSVTVLTAPDPISPPPMTNRLDSVSLVTSTDAVIANSARSVQHSNAQWNQQAYDSYLEAVRSWKDNNGMRWVSSGQMMRTTEPPPPPQYLPTDYNQIYADISANYAAGRPPEDVNAKRPYYMGGSIYMVQS